MKLSTRQDFFCERSLDAPDRRGFMAYDRRPPPGRRRSGPPQRRRDDTLVVTPSFWSPRGEAVCPGETKPLLVWQGIPGDQCRVEVRGRGSQQVYTHWKESRLDDPRRVEPICSKFHPCGGCPLMHVVTEAQYDARTWLVAAALESQALGEIEVAEMKASPDGELGFRHVVKLVAARSDRGHPQLGAPGRFTRRVVPIPECHVVHPDLRLFTKSAAHQMIELDVRPYDGERGLLRFVQARRSRKTGDLLVTIVARYNLPLLAEYAEALAQTVDRVVGVHLHINDRDDNVIFDRDDDGAIGTRQLVGERFLIDSLTGVDYHIGPADFFQTNPSVAEVLYQDVIDAVAGGAEGELEGVPVVDLYSGVGGFALALASKTGWALGVEFNAEAVQRARNAARAGRVPAEFLRGRVAEVLPDLARRLSDRRPVVVVDPARRGLEDEVVEGILALHPRRVVYVSCSPRSLARDLARFVALGWTVGTIQPYDMFPQTAHVELMAVLDPPDADEAPAKRGPRRRIVR